MIKPYSANAGIQWGSAPVLSLLFSVFALASGIACDAKLSGLAMATGAIAALMAGTLMLNYLNGHYVRS